MCPHARAHCCARRRLHFQDFTSLLPGRPDGAPHEVLVITLALLILDVKSGDVGYTDKWCTRVLETSKDYEVGKAWAVPEGWRYSESWITKHLSTITEDHSNDTAHAIGFAFCELAVDFADNVSFFPTKSNLYHYFRQMRDGTLQGLASKSRIRRLNYLAPRVAALARAHGGQLREALNRGVLDALRRAARDGKTAAQSSAHKGVVKANNLALEAGASALEDELDAVHDAHGHLKRKYDFTLAHMNQEVARRVAGRAETMRARADARVERDVEREVSTRVAQRR